MNGVPFFPPIASTAAGEFHLLSFGLLAITSGVYLLVVWLVVSFSVRYRKSRTDANRDHRIKKSWYWEVGWTSASFFVFLGLFIWGADLYLREHKPPPDVSDIYVVGKQWMWKTEYPDGQREINALHLALGRPVRLVMTSEDVIHDFFVPAFRLKQDVLPGRYVSLWFTPTRVGTYHLFCAQLCGTDHASMIGTVVVMAPADFEKWLAETGTSGDLAQRGEALFRSLGCSGCHGSASTVKAPPLDGLYGHPVPLDGGRVAIADETYIRDSILQPSKDIAAGYPDIMPPFAGQIDEDQLLSLVAYIKSLANERPAR